MLGSAQPEQPKFPQMPIIVTPETGIPLPFDTTPEEIEDFRVKAHAYFNTVQELERQGLEVAITDEDTHTAHQIMTTEKFPPNRAIKPGTIVKLEALLNDWDYEFLDARRKLRNYVTNKLLEKSEDPDPKVALKALELLGKTSGVGAFSERVDINVTHRTIADIESELKKTLELYSPDFHTVEPEPVPEPANIGAIDLDAELSDEP